MKKESFGRRTSAVSLSAALAISVLPGAYNAIPEDASFLEKLNGVRASLGSSETILSPRVDKAGRVLLADHGGFHKCFEKADSNPVC